MYKSKHAILNSIVFKNKSQLIYIWKKNFRTELIELIYNKKMEDQLIQAAKIVEQQVTNIDYKIHFGVKVD